MSTFERQGSFQPQLISTSELAKIINHKSQTIRKWLCQDKLPDGLPRPKKINGRHYWLRNDITGFLLTFAAKEEL